jgi:streptomycin 6-kinase
LASLLDPFLERWGLEPDEGPVPPVRYQGASAPPPGSIVFVRRGDERLVLKALPPEGEEARAALVLAHWAGEGAVRLVEAAPQAMLMERAWPGDELEPLVEAGKDDAATLALCEVMQKLNKPAPAGGGFRTIEDWGRGFARNRPAWVDAGWDVGLVDEAESLFFRLCATQGPPVLLHGDLHHQNVVLDEHRGWLAIDPKGILGEAVYETGALLRNPQHRLCARPEIIERRARLMTDRLGYARRRILEWCFAQWVLSLLWCLEDAIPLQAAWLEGPLAARSLL